MSLFENGPKAPFVVVPPPSYKPLSRACRGPSVTSLCRGPLCTRVFNRLVSGRVCRKTPRLCYKPCRQKVARACYKPDAFGPQPHVLHRRRWGNLYASKVPSLGFRGGGGPCTRLQHSCAALQTEKKSTENLMTGGACCSW